MEKLKMEVVSVQDSQTPDDDKNIKQQHKLDLAQTEPDAAKSYSMNELYAMSLMALQEIESSGGEISDEIDRVLALVELHKPIKIDACVYMLDLFKERAAFLKKKELEFYNAWKTCENIQERMKNRIKDGMTQLGESVAMGNEYRFRLSIREKPKLVVDKKQLPDAFCDEVTVLEPNDERIKQALDLGIQIPGAKYEPVKILTHSVNTTNKSNKKELK